MPRGNVAVDFLNAFNGAFDTTRKVGQAYEMAQAANAQPDQNQQFTPDQMQALQNRALAGDTVSYNQGTGNYDVTARTIDSAASEPNYAPATTSVAPTSQYTMFGNSQATPFTSQQRAAAIANQQASILAKYGDPQGGLRLQSDSMKVADQAQAQQYQQKKDAALQTASKAFAGAVQNGDYRTVYDTYVKGAINSDPDLAAHSTFDPSTGNVHVVHTVGGQSFQTDLAPAQWMGLAVQGINASRTGDPIEGLGTMAKGFLDAQNASMSQASTAGEIGLRDIQGKVLQQNADTMKGYRQDQGDSQLIRAASLPGGAASGKAPPPVPWDPKAIQNTPNFRALDADLRSKVANGEPNPATGKPWTVADTFAERDKYTQGQRQAALVDYARSTLQNVPPAQRTAWLKGHGFSDSGINVIFPGSISSGPPQPGGVRTPSGAALAGGAARANPAASGTNPSYAQPAAAPANDATTRLYATPQGQYVQAADAAVASIKNQLANLDKQRPPRGGLRPSQATRLSLPQWQQYHDALANSLTGALQAQDEAAGPWQQLLERASYGQNTGGL